MSPPRRRTAYARERITAGQRNAVRVVCRTCGRDVLRGADGRVLAFVVDVEVHRATAVEEVLARGLRGRPSYDVNRSGPDVEITVRDVITVRVRPGVAVAGQGVHLAHACADEARPEPPEPLALFELDAPPPY